MSVAVLVNDEQQASQVLPWGVRFAQAESTDLLVIITKRTKGQSKWNNLDLGNADTLLTKAIARQAKELGIQFQASGDLASADVDAENGRSSSTSVSINHVSASDSEHVQHFQDAENADDVTPVLLQVREFCDPDPGFGIANQIELTAISLLIIPHYVDSKSERDETLWQQYLYRNAPCRTMYLHDDIVRKTEKLKVLVVVTGNQDDTVALQAGFNLADDGRGTMTALYVEPDIDQYAREVGERILSGIAKSALGPDVNEITQLTVLADNVVRGIGIAEAQDYDIVLVGSRWHREIRQLMSKINKLDATDSPAICTIRRNIPLRNRVANTILRGIQHYVPQLNREERISLVERVQSSSQWDFDFVALICLSTLIAGLGLIRNSAAVVIGAMLVAPLMTPIVGAGLGIAQGNIQLIRTSARTVLRGFATAFFIGIVLGLSVFTFQHAPKASPEMISRGLPSFLDLIVALVSGIAAAYAMGRPNLLSALPGVAIAAALVPPLATSGMAVALAEWSLAEGALLLFLTNIVAIVVGTTVTFWFVGLRSEKRDKPTRVWPQWLLFALVLVTILLTALITLLERALVPVAPELGNSLEALFLPRS